MDPATVFLVYVAGALGLWFVANVVHPVLDAVSRFGVHLPMGRRFAAFAISFVLVAGVVRIGAARGSVGPPNERMVLMVDDVLQVHPIVESAAYLSAASPAVGAYVVEPGDSLWRIARVMLGSNGDSPSGHEISDLWRAIYERNRDLIGNDPNLIHPGQVLQLPAR